MRSRSTPTKKIGADEFARERTLQNGWIINTKEEWLYYRLFREQFGDFDLSWMGRIKGAPVQRETRIRENGFL
jgi:hypothetical protein